MLSTLAIILLVPYFAWGIHGLRLRFRYHEEFSLVVEALTLLGLLFFYAVEIALLREALAHSKLQLAMAVLGLITSGMALFGHVAISFLSRLIVDAVVTGQDTQDDRPRLGPAEALEKQQDFNGALNEYFVLARMYPKDDVVHLRIAVLLVKLARAKEAASWLERAAKCASTEDRALAVTHRQVELFEQHLQQPEAARAALGAFLDRYPNAKEAPELRARLANIGHKHRAPEAATLVALADTPLVERPVKPAKRRERAEPKSHVSDDRDTTAEDASTPALAALDDAPVLNEEASTHNVPERAPDAAIATFALEKLDDAAPFGVPEEEEPPRENRSSIGLEPLDPA